MLGDVLRALGIQHRLNDAMAVPLLGAVEVGASSVSVRSYVTHVGLLWRGAHPAPMVVTRLCNTHRNSGGASTRSPTHSCAAPSCSDGWDTSSGRCQWWALALVGRVASARPVGLAVACAFMAAATAAAICS